MALRTAADKKCRPAAKVQNTEIIMQAAILPQIFGELSCARVEGKRAEEGLEGTRRQGWPLANDSFSRLIVLDDDRGLTGNRNFCSSEYIT